MCFAFKVSMKASEEWNNWCNVLTCIQRLLIQLEKLSYNFSIIIRYVERFWRFLFVGICNSLWPVFNDITVENVTSINLTLIILVRHTSKHSIIQSVKCENKDLNILIFFCVFRSIWPSSEGASQHDQESLLQLSWDIFKIYASIRSL
jgi:hypothetical protein